MILRDFLHLLCESTSTTPFLKQHWEDVLAWKRLAGVVGCGRQQESWRAAQRMEYPGNGVEKLILWLCAQSPIVRYYVMNALP